MVSAVTSAQADIHAADEYLFAAGFDQSLASVIGKMSHNRSVRKLCIGRNLTGIKQRYFLGLVFI